MSQSKILIEGLRLIADKLEALGTVEPEPEPEIPPPATDALFTDHAFAPSSFWYQQIPANAPLHPNQVNLVKEIPRQMKAYYGTVNINTTQYCAPLYIATKDTPRFNVGQYNPRKEPGWAVHAGLAEQWKNVPISLDAKPSAGTDMEMAVYDPLNDMYYEFWLMRKTASGGWEARWGGRIQNVSKSDGVFPGTFGTTATSLPFLGGQITAEELQRGEIRHAIGFSLVEAEHHNLFVWPAHRSDGWNPDKVPNRIKEGQRFRLNPAINIDSLNLHPVAKIIAKAAQKYGFVVWDKAGAISLRTQNAISYPTNPYPALFNKVPSYEVLKGFPWNEIQFLTEGYGQA